MDLYEQAVFFLLMLIGVFCHFCKDMVKLKADGLIMTPVKYWTDNKWQTCLSVAGVIAFYFIAQAELTRLTCFAAGFMCNSLADILGSRGMGKVQDQQV
jgi:hypothetical protein